MNAKASGDSISLRVSFSFRVFSFSFRVFRSPENWYFLSRVVVLEPEWGSTAGGALKSGPRQEEPWLWVGVPSRRSGAGVHGRRILKSGPWQEEPWW